jgi:hypothetical protein
LTVHLNLHAYHIRLVHIPLTVHLNLHADENVRRINLEWWFSNNAPPNIHE